MSTKAIAAARRRKTDAELDATVRRLRLAGWSSKYSEQSSNHLNRYIRTCVAHDWPVLPVTDQTLARYAAHRYETSDITGPSFATELYGIRQGLMRMNIYIDIRQNGPLQRVAQVLQAWKKVRGRKYERAPITSDVLKAFFTHLNPAKYDDQVTRAVLALAKFGMMRVSEYTSKQGEEGPCVGDLRLYPDARETRFMALYFSKSKRNQSGRIERVICTCCCPNPCPVHEVSRMLAMRPSVAPGDALFKFSSGKAPTARAIRRIIKALCKLCGLDPARFATHGLRAGGVTDVLCAGVSDSVVQILARHASLESLKPYKRLSDEDLGTILSIHLTRAMAKGCGARPT